MAGIMTDQFQEQGARAVSLTPLCSKAKIEESHHLPILSDVAYVNWLGTSIGFATLVFCKEREPDSCNRDSPPSALAKLHAIPPNLPLTSLVGELLKLRTFWIRLSLWAPSFLNQWNYRSSPNQILLTSPNLEIRVLTNQVIVDHYM